MARTRNRNNQGKNTGLKSLSTGRLKTVGFAPAAANRGADGNQRRAAVAGGLSGRRRANNNTAAFGGFNAAGFGIKANTANASSTARGGNAGASDARRRTSRNNTDGFRAAGRAARTGRSRSSGG